MCPHAAWRRHPPPQGGFYGSGIEPQDHALLVRNIFAIERHTTTEAASYNTTRISLVFGPDDLCRACPHLKDGACSIGDASVLSMDHAAARALSLHEASYTYDALRRKLRCDLTRSGFERCCGSCSWYEKGVCSYAKLTAALFDENAQSMP